MADVTGSPQGRAWSWRGMLQGIYGLILGLVILCAVATAVSPSFIHIENVLNVLRQVALFGIVSVGMTFVILTAGIDISVGSIIGVTAVTAAQLLNAGIGIPAAVVLTLVAGGLMGAVNGLGVTLGRIPPFIMTLALLVIGRGMALSLSSGEPIYLGDHTPDFTWLGGGFLLGLPVPVWVFAFVAAAGFVSLRYTRFGRNVYAVGSNAEAARLSGIGVQRTYFAVYVISGVLAGLTGLIFVSRLTVGEPTVGTGMELQAITITVIGGTSLFGGEGELTGTIIGAMILAVLANILNLFGISPFTQQIITGAIIIAAVLLELRKNRE